MKTDTPRTDAKLHRANYSNTMPYVCAEFARELERENAKLRAALERIEEIFVDGSDTHDDWRAMGQIARDMLSNGPHQTQPEP